MIIIMNQNKPDDRRDNASKIKANIASVKANIEAADEMIAITSDDKTKKDLQAKNERREVAINSLENELKDEQ